VPRVIYRKKKEVTHILAPYVSAWCEARLSIGVARQLNEISTPLDWLLDPAIRKKIGIVKPPFASCVVCN